FPGCTTNRTARRLTVRPLVRGECALRRRGRADRVARTPEGDEERVALGAHLLAAELRKRVTHQRAVVRKDGRITVAQLAEQARRALDVGEKKRDRSADGLLTQCSAPPPLPRAPHWRQRAHGWLSGCAHHCAR